MRHFYRLMLTLTVVAMGSVTFLSETATAQCALSQFGSGTLEVGLSGAFTEGGATVPQVPTGIVITPNPGACQVAIQFTEPTADPANTCMPGTVNESGSGGSAPGVIYSLGLGQGTTYQLLVGGVPQGDANDTYNISIDVIDDILPTLTCPLAGTVLPHTTAAANCSYDAPEFSTIAGSDVCSPIVTYTTTWTGVAPTMGSGSITGRDLPSLNKGSYTIEVSVSDGAGNTTDFSSCSFTLNITDETPATHTCPVDVTVELQRGALPIVTQGTPGAGEQAWATTTATGANAFPAVNEFFVLDDALDNCGVTAMKWRAAVISDNCPEYTVTINSDIAASNTANNRTGIFNAVTVAPLSSATNQAIPATYSSSTEKSITVFARGRGNTPNLLGKNVYNESYLVTDCSGSTFECAFTVTVIDSGSITPAPSACAVTDTITVGTNGTVISGANVTTSASAPAAAGAMTVDGTTANDCGLVNVQYRSEVYQDNCAAYTIEIASELDPELGSYWALDEISGAGADQALAIGTNSVAVTTDLVTGVPSSFEIKYTGAAGTVAKGIYNESYKITDCGGFTTGCEFTVNVVDNERPVASACPSDLTIGTSGATISTAVDGLTPVAGTAFCAAGVNVAFDIATDNCPEGSYTFETTGASTTPISTLSPTVTTGTPNTFEVSTADVALEKGTTTFTYTFYDCGSTNVAPAMATTPAVCTFNVTVIDDEDPISSLCPPSIVINTDGVTAGFIIIIGPSIIGAAAVQTLGDCAAEVSWAAPQTLDNCPEGTYTVSVDFSDAAGAPARRSATRRPGPGTALRFPPAPAAGDIAR